MSNSLATTREEPSFRKCRFCIPERLYLQTWAYIKMAVDVLVILYMLVIIAIYGFVHRDFFNRLSVFHFMVLCEIAVCVDFGFLVTLVVGIFRKNQKLLRVFYFYEFYVITVEIVALIIIAGNAFIWNPGEGMILLIIGILYITFDIFITMTVKSERNKLRHKKQFEFAKIQDCREEGLGCSEEEA